MVDTSAGRHRASTRRKTTAVVSAAILLVVSISVAAIFLTEPSAEKTGATKKTAMLVEVVSAERGTYRPRIVAQGTVEPARDIVLRAQVGGRITWQAPAFTPGGFVRKGDRLVQIEPADFEHALAQRQSELRQARSELALERGRHDAARSEYAYVEEELSPENKALVLREPQLDAAEARVDAARAAVEQARLSLRRTSVEAPFDAHIVSREVNVGSLVSADDNLARLVGIDTYWVAVELPVAKLRWISMPRGQEPGSPVQVRNRRAWPPDTYRRGHIIEVVYALEEQTRMARVLAAVSDPLARRVEDHGRPALIIGSFVEVAILGAEIEDVVRLDRNYVREGETVWLMKDDVLRVNQVEVVIRDADYAYISDGLEEGDLVVTTNLSTVVDGAPLRLQPPTKGGADE